MTPLLYAIALFAFVGIGSAIIEGPHSKITEEIVNLEEELIEMEISVALHPISASGPNK